MTMGQTTARQKLREFLNYLMEKFMLVLEKIPK
jgi:hypothetical protein